jgi:hypothetical protein
MVKNHKDTKDTKFFIVVNQPDMIWNDTPVSKIFDYTFTKYKVSPVIFFVNSLTESNWFFYSGAES